MNFNFNNLANTELMLKNALADSTFTAETNSTPTVEIATEVPIGSHRGDTFHFHRYQHVTPASTIIRDDLPSPQPESLNREFIPAKINFYGRSVLLSSQFVYYDQFDNEMMAAELLGISMIRGQEEILRDKLLSTTNIISCANGSNSDDPTHFSLADLLDVEAWHYRNNSLQFTKSIMGSPNENSTPINACYIMLMPTDLSVTLKSLPEFVSPERYGNPAMRFSINEFGTLSHHRFLMSTGYNDVVRSSAGGEPVQQSVSLGQGAISQLVPSDPSSTRLERIDTSATDIHRQLIVLALTYVYSCAITAEYAVTKVEFTKS